MFFLDDALEALTFFFLETLIRTLPCFRSITQLHLSGFAIPFFAAKYTSALAARQETETAGAAAHPAPCAWLQVVQRPQLPLRETLGERRLAMY
jgi:hypothetical protein